MNLFGTPSSIHTRRAAQSRRIWADPLTVRQWHNPADPVQAARIEAAAAKREARAEKRTAWATNSFMWNVAHYPNQCGGEFNPPKTFNPFYIAK